MVQLNFKRLTTTAKLPTQAYDTDAGIDFYADFYDVQVKDKTTCFVKVNTGIAWQPEFIYNSGLIYPIEHFNIYMQLCDKSGFSTKTGLTIIGGVIDQSYRGEIIACFVSHFNSEIILTKGQKICQGIVKLIPKITIAEIQELSDTERGSDGFGSTGKF